MTATRKDIEGWLGEAKRQGARWLIVARDDFNPENYPIYVVPDDDPWDYIDHIGEMGMGDKYDEVYDLEMDIERQLRESRAMHLPRRAEASAHFG